MTNVMSSASGILLLSVAPFLFNFSSTGNNPHAELLFGILKTLPCLDVLFPLFFLAGWMENFGQIVSLALGWPHQGTSCKTAHCCCEQIWIHHWASLQFCFHSQNSHSGTNNFEQQLQCKCNNGKRCQFDRSREMQSLPHSSLLWGHETGIWSHPYLQHLHTQTSPQAGVIGSGASEIVFKQGKYSLWRKFSCVEKPRLPLYNWFPQFKHQFSLLHKLFY